VYAAEGRIDKALDAFERSVDAGFADVGTVNIKGFDPLRSEPRFIAAVARMEASAQSAQRAQAPNGYVSRTAPMRSRGTYIVMLPPDYDTSRRQYPLCILLHGGGGNEREHGRAADLLGRDGVIYVAVRAPFANGPTSFLAWPPEAYPPESPVWGALRNDYVDWISDVIKAVRKEFRVRSRSTFIEGYSEGGQFATLTALLHPDMVNGYLVESGSAVPDKWFTSERLARMKRHGVTVWRSGFSMVYPTCRFPRMSPLTSRSACNWRESSSHFIRWKARTASAVKSSSLDSSGSAR
jgi:pimeloyl-ACP methyl ester carboxylesterase